MYQTIDTHTLIYRYLLPVPTSKYQNKRKEIRPQACLWESLLSVSTWFPVTEGSWNSISFKTLVCLFSVLCSAKTETLPQFDNPSKMSEDFIDLG